MTDPSEIMNWILDTDKKYVVIEGVCDIINPREDNPDNVTYYHFKDLTSERFWRIIGRGEDSSIIESLNEFECGVDCEGEYHFKAMLKWNGGEYDECGRCIMRDYLELEHIEFYLIQTFLERERHSKLDQIFNDKFEDLFK